LERRGERFFLFLYENNILTGNFFDDYLSYYCIKIYTTMKNLLFLSFLALIFAAGCKKSNDTSDTTPTTNLSIFLTKYAEPSQFYTVTAGQSDTIYGTKGTRITTYQNSFYPIMSGDIKIELKEFYSRKDVILNNLQTQSDNRLLATAGMIYINVTQNGTPVNHWALNTRMLAQATNNDMQVFYSYTQPGDSSINWNLPDSSYIYASSGGSYPAYYSHIISSNHFQWINCDYFVGQLPVTNVAATITNVPQSTSQPIVYLVLDINAISKMWLVQNNNVFCIPNILEGLTGKIVAFTVENGNYYLCIQPITVTTNMNQSLTFQTVTEQEMITALDSL
jgi:hypothetical protein